MTDLASLEVWKETAEFLATKVTEAEPGSWEQGVHATGLLHFCLGVLSVDEVDELLNGD